MKLLDEYREFVTQADGLVSNLGISPEDVVQCDTICYNVNSNQRYEEVKQELEQIALLISETEVNGRLISVLECTPPLPLDSGKVLSFIELAQPKCADDREIIDHVQYVTRVGIDHFKEAYPNVQFEEKGNPRNRLLQAKQGEVVLRFHQANMGAVVEQEKRGGV